MLKFFVCVSALSFAALGPALAEPHHPATKVAVPFAPTKTSDRTPDNPSPDRTPGASQTGAAGTEVARTSDGTSDRTPSNHYRPHAY